jgi:hypothetical protein
VTSEYDILIGRTKKKRELDKPRSREKDNTANYLKNERREDVVWIQLAISCEYSNKPLGSIKDGEFLDYMREY